MTRLPVRTIGVHDIGPVIDLADGYDLVRASVQLFSRADGYTSPLTIGMYMPEVALEDVTPVSSTMTGNTYVFILNRSDVEDASGEALNIPIRFTVKTGSEFESAGLTYANYKIQLTVKLVKSNGGGGYDELAPSEDTNYIIYTNARVLPDFISEIAP